MPARLSQEQRRIMLRLLLEGLSYGEVATEAGVSKSTVAGVWQEFANGHFPELEQFGEYAGMLREVASGLRQSGVSVYEAHLGLSAMQYLGQVGVEPHRIIEWVQLCQRLATDTQDAAQMVRAALELEELEHNTGLDYQTLSERTQELDERRETLEGEVEHLEVQREEAEGLHRKILETRKELEELRNRRDRLRKDVDQRQSREQALAQQVEGLEERVQAADERLVSARKEVRELAALGLSLEDFAVVVQRLIGVAQRHGWKSADLLGRLLAELEKLDSGLRLGALVEGKREELAGLENEAEQCRAEAEEVRGAVAKLRRDRRRLEGALSVFRDQAQVEIQKAGRETVTLVRQNSQVLQDELASLLNKVMEVGANVAQFEVNLRSHEWLKILLALVGERDELTSSQVRGLILILLPPVRNWMEAHRHVTPILARLSLDGLIRNLEEWRP